MNATKAAIQVLQAADRAFNMCGASVTEDAIRIRMAVQLNDWKHRVNTQVVCPMHGSLSAY